MEFSKKERLILANQYKILEKLDEYKATYYGKLAEALERGYEAECEDLYANISDGLNVSDCQWVFDVLAMFADLSDAYSQLSDKNGINEHDVKFRGFDRRNEADFKDYANYLIKYKGPFPGLKGADGSSPYAPIYNRMLKKFNELKKSDREWLNKETIIQITEAALLPA